MRSLFLLTGVLFASFAAAAQPTTQIFDGRLEAGDATLTSGEYYDAYDVTVQAGLLIEVDHVSTAFDPFLIVIRPDGGTWENDDYQGSRTRSRIEQVVPETGVYRIIATSFAPGETGAYRVTVRVSEGNTFPPCASTAQPFVVAGGAVDTQGRRLSGALVSIHSQSIPGSNVQGTTGEDGCFRLDLPTFASTWTVGAETARDFNGRTYRFPLHGNASPLAGNQGAIRSFEWRLTGPMPDGGFYGSSVLVYAPLEIEETDVELTLTPVGALVDGSAGATITRSAVSTGDGWALPDVPVGRYRITARHVPTNRRMDVRRRNEGAFTPEITLDFEAPFGGLAIYQMKVETQIGTGTAGEGGPAAEPEMGLTVGPNPARGATQVTLTLAAPLDVAVEVLDALGRHVARLHDGALAAGPHTLRFDPSALPPGAYFVRATTATSVVTRPVTVAR